MLFNSAIFLVFFSLVYILYWFVFKRSRLWVLLLSGCIFYGCWDWRFLILLFFTSGVDFISAKKIEVSEKIIGKRWLVVSIIVNLTTLGFFKYYNFFASSFIDFLGLFEFKPSLVTINVILPVGISFYTFQSIAYVTDVYRRKIKPEYSALHYFSFICFFPQMVAGPIERAKWMLPQFRKEKEFNTHYFESGINLILYGLFKKVVIADNLALLVDEIHKNPTSYSSESLLLGVIAFAIQIYTDFSGYSDIARGCAQLLGFRLSKNFYFPYFSSSLKQFWQRWHISLSSWFRDYVYIPLGGSKGSIMKKNFNLIITFLVSGLWHGANMTFILWGFFHGSALAIERKIKTAKGIKVAKTILVFFLVSYLFTLFRSPGIIHFYYYSKQLFSLSEGTLVLNYKVIESGIYFLIPFVFFVVMEIIKYKKRGLGKYSYNYTTNFCLIVLIILFSVFENAPNFIYFQF